MTVGRAVAPAPRASRTSTIAAMSWPSTSSTCQPKAVHLATSSPGACGGSRPSGPSPCQPNCWSRCGRRSRSGCRGRSGGRHRGLPDLALLALAVAQHHERAHVPAGAGGRRAPCPSPPRSPCPAIRWTCRDRAAGSCPDGPGGGSAPRRRSAAPRPGSSPAAPSRHRGRSTNDPWTARSGRDPARPARRDGSASRGSRAPPAGRRPTAARRGGRPRAWLTALTTCTRIRRAGSSRAAISAGSAAAGAPPIALMRAPARTTRIPRAARTGTAARGRPARLPRWRGTSPA